MNLVAAGADGFRLGFDEGVATCSARVDDGRPVIVDTDVLQCLVALGASELSAEVVCMLRAYVATAEVVYDLFCVYGRLSALGARLDVQHVGVQAVGAEVYPVDKLGGSEDALFHHGLHENEIFAQLILAQTVEEVKDRYDVTCRC